MGWHGFDHGMSAWGWAAMTGSLVLILGLLVIGGVLLARTSRRAPERGAPFRTPEQVLADRFARGEIDHEEYRRRLDTLSGARHR